MRPGAPPCDGCYPEEYSTLTRIRLPRYLRGCIALYQPACDRSRLRRRAPRPDSLPPDDDSIPNQGTNAEPLESDAYGAAFLAPARSPSSPFCSNARVRCIFLIALALDGSAPPLPSRWPMFIGIAGYSFSERVAKVYRNGWPNFTGIGGRGFPEYAETGRPAAMPLRPVGLAACPRHLTRGHCTEGRAVLPDDGADVVAGDHTVAKLLERSDQHVSLGCVLVEGMAQGREQGHLLWRQANGQHLIASHANPLLLSFVLQTCGPGVAFRPDCIANVKHSSQGEMLRGGQIAASASVHALRSHPGSPAAVLRGRGDARSPRPSP